MSVHEELLALEEQLRQAELGSNHRCVDLAATMNSFAELRAHG